MGGPEEGGVSVEHAEVVDRTLLEPATSGGIARGVGALTQLIQPAAKAALEVGNHPAQVVHDNFQVRVSIEHAREQKARHSDRGLVWPAKGPPQVVLRALL